MVDDETPTTADKHAGAEGDPSNPQGEGAQNLPGGEAPDAKLIGADVFLSRLAERQEERDSTGFQLEAIDALLGALDSLGFDPNTVAPDFVRMARAAALADDTFVDADAEAPDLETLAVEERFLSERRAGGRPSVSDYIRRYPAQREALLRLVMSQELSELAEGATPEELAPEDEQAARAGQEEGVRRALSVVERRGIRRRGAPDNKVAEERARYDANDPGAADEKGRTPRHSRHRARPVPPEENRPED